MIHQHTFLYFIENFFAMAKWAPFDADFGQAPGVVGRLIDYAVKADGKWNDPKGSADLSGWRTCSCCICTRPYMYSGQVLMERPLARRLTSPPRSPERHRLPKRPSASSGARKKMVRDGGALK